MPARISGAQPLFHWTHHAFHKESKGRPFERWFFDSFPKLSIESARTMMKNHMICTLHYFAHSKRP